MMDLPNVGSLVLQKSERNGLWSQMQDSVGDQEYKGPMFVACKCATGNAAA